MARSFNGTTEQCALGNATSLFFSSPGTVSAWVKLSALPSGTTNIFIAIDSGSSHFYGLAVGSAHKLLGELNGGSVSGGTILSTNTWYHGVIVAPSSSNATCTVYLNGASDGTGTGSWGAPSLSPLAGIGYDPQNAGRNWAGTIADVAVWNVALTALEVNGLSQGMRPYQIRPSALKGYWPIDGIASPEPDLSGNAKNGTLTGTALAFGPPFAPQTPRLPQNNTVVAAAGGVKWEIFMRHSMLPMLLAANPNMTRREAMLLLGMAKEL